MRILACALLLAAAPCLAQDIVVGQSAPLTGANAELGNDIRSGTLAYFKRVNDASGLAQGKIKLVTLDDRNDTKFSGENTARLVKEQDVVALFGTIRATYADEIFKIINFWGNLGNTRVTVLHYDDTVGKQNFETVANVLKKFDRTPVSMAIKRNADIADQNVKDAIASDPQVMVVTTLYAPAAQMIKRLKVAHRATMVTSLSFAGASQLAKALGPDAAGVSVAITVPTPRARTVPVVKECDEAWTAAGHKEPMSVTALESCIAAKAMVEGMKRAGREVTRASLHRSLSALGRYDAGGYVVDFKPNFRHGGSSVGMALLKPNGEVRD